MDLTTRAAMLTARRNAILAHLEQIEDALDDPLPKDWDDAAIEQQDDEVLQALGNAEQAELKRIDAALRRIADGDYGWCTRCGERIADARLDLLPDTPLCADCAGRG
ncbi:transcriptional regulator, TraR/DksA family [Paracoccus aminovorans]|uniref:Transcriptional regulator, TraR/DksA family n=2 Tax=Paracoccus aminovorans TaxID=34004 RepID=A0A1I2XHN4_9RHOB|nr:TraR/DksA family transcriptional regulator [Paracoccus aminovorans]CQR85758.1 dimethylmenaquinone methyltransferase [Paracoccus aminovorans]SFH12990.1 transcriptional regulator, TraR/DksA family [Paracoccus aminovorans]